MCFWQQKIFFQLILSCLRQQLFKCSPGATPLVALWKVAPSMCSLSTGLAMAASEHRPQEDLLLCIAMIQPV